jgi:hypothetical protein
MLKYLAQTYTAGTILSLHILVEQMVFDEARTQG